MSRPFEQKSAKTSSLGDEARSDSFAPAAEKLRAQRPLKSQRCRLAATHLAANRADLAEKELTEHLALHPDDADALSLMARTQLRLGRSNRAASLLARCLDLAPDFTAARFNLAELLFKLKKFDVALQELDRLLMSDSDNPLFRQLKANVLESLGRNEEALAICEQLAEENPGRPDSWISFGHALRAMGYSEKSVSAYRKAIALRPSFGKAYWSLANMKSARFDDSDIAAMQAQLKRPDIAADDRIQMQYALGKAFEDRGTYDQSFEQYAKANAGIQVRIKYDPEGVTRLVAASKALFTPAYLHSRGDAGCEAIDPIFVLGLPRSGSTLIEQILASHSAIEALGELPYITSLVNGLEEREGLGPRVDYTRILSTLEPAALRALGQEYVERTRQHRKLGRPFFIDKKPPNWLHAGFIHLILPKAKIIDVRRHPAACCLSQFKQYFNKAHPGQAELGRLYRDYLTLMAHFDSVLPGRIHQLIYESMVANPEAETRRLLGHLGLPFEESCLRFFETKRPVLTPSSEQVRRPISGEGVDHWRNYEPWLAPLLESLGSALTAYPSVPEELR